MSTSLSQKSAESDYIAIQREHNRIHFDKVAAAKRKLEQQGIPYVNWTNAMLESSEKFMELILLSMYDDDKIADFGSRNGMFADHILGGYYMEVLCVDILPEYVEECQSRNHKALCADLEKLPLEDDEIDWGFSHHTLEHTKDLDKVASELTRVVKRGLFLVFPLESAKDASKNPSHMHHSMDPDYFLQHFLSRGWRIGWNEMPNKKRPDFQCFLYK